MRVMHGARSDVGLSVGASGGYFFMQPVVWNVFFYCLAVEVENCAQKTSVQGVAEYDSLIAFRGFALEYKLTE